MVLVTTGILLSNNRKIINNVLNYENVSATLNNNIYILTFISLILFFTTLPAVLVATHCNPDDRVLYGIIGVLFSDIYLIQWSIKKFILKKTNYCKIK